MQSPQFREVRKPLLAPEPPAVPDAPPPVPGEAQRSPADIEAEIRMRVDEALEKARADYLARATRLHELHETLTAAQVWRARAESAGDDFAESLAKAHDAARRAAQLAETQGEKSLAQRAAGLIDELDSLGRNGQLINALQAAWIADVMAIQDQACAALRGVEPQAERSAALAMYQLALAQWGLDLSGDSAEAAKRIAALPPRGKDLLAAALLRVHAARPPAHGPPRELVQQILDAAHSTPAQEKLRQAIFSGDPATLTAIAREWTAHDNAPAQSPTALDSVLLALLLHEIASPRAASESSESEPLILAVELLRRAQTRHPSDLVANLALARLTSAVRRLRQAGAAQGEALRAATAAVALAPRNAASHECLAIAALMAGNDSLPLAIRHAQVAVQLAPDRAGSYCLLGVALESAANLQGALAAYDSALALDADLARAQLGRGVILRLQGKLDEALVAFQHAAELRSTDPAPHVQTAAVHLQRGDLSAAMQSVREAIRIDANSADAHLQLGIVHERMGDLEQAEAELRATLALEPRFLHAQAMLGSVLCRRDKFKEGVDMLRQALAANPQNAALQELLKEAESLLALEARLPDILAKRQQPKDARECLQLASLCYIKQRYVASGRFYGRAFSIDKSLAENLAANHRFLAARSAALAGSGQGDGKPLNEEIRGLWRAEARKWLRADLTLWQAVLKGDSAAEHRRAAQMLALWQRDAALASIRDAPQLARYPVEERKLHEQLWRDVADTLAALESAPARNGG